MQEHEESVAAQVYTGGWSMNIINTYDQLKAAVSAGILPKNQALAVTYHARPQGRMGIAMCNKSQVYSPFFKTDPNSAWYDYGHKTFIGNRAESFPKAKEWASEQYGITDWLPNAMRCHVPAIVQKRFPIRKEAPSKQKSIESNVG
jgi:hypothetical protein